MASLEGIAFTKAHACGNDFLIVERSSVPDNLHAEAARRLCSRTTGVGADGVEFFEWTAQSEGRIGLRNADGSVAEISGNGTRCVAAWMAKQLDAGAGCVLKIRTDAGIRECRVVHADNACYEIVSGMGLPAIRTASIQLSDGTRIEGAIVNVGNPHFVIFVDHFDHPIAHRSWQSIGEEICNHTDFPQQTNVEFVHIEDAGRIEIRIFERGVGPTTSSGTGTCASAAAAMSLQACNRELRVLAPGGWQQVQWPEESAELLLTGPAEIIASGSVFLTLQGGAA